MLEGYVRTMDKHAAKLSEFLGRSVGTKKAVDVFPIIKRTTLDIICGEGYVQLYKSVDFRDSNGNRSEFSGR